MRERTIEVNKDKLAALSALYRPSKVAERLQISKQRWRLYEIGRNDVPESMVKRICDEFDLSERDLILAP